MLQGKVGTTTGWDCKDEIWEPREALYAIPPWMPHRFWPVPDSTEDCVLICWAHPNDKDSKMDHIFFKNLLMYVSDVSEKKASMDPFQIMLTQHITATALIMLPKWTFLGPLRWWIPLKVQALFAAVARLRGYKPMMKKYTPDDVWDQLYNSKES